MTLRLRPALVLLALPILSIALATSWGAYTRPVFFATMIAYLIGLAAAVMPDDAIRLGRAVNCNAVLLALVAIGLTAGAIPFAKVVFPDVERPSNAIPCIAYSGCGLTLVIALIWSLHAAGWLPD